tara:strand:- start:485 stop:1042 length:558 start_codon:yes stop_codon:yes gene_type:complete
MRFTIEFPNNYVLCLGKWELVQEAIPNHVYNEYLTHRKSDPFFNTVTEQESNNIVVMSEKLEPIRFYLDDTFFRCSKTNKYLSCFTYNRLCCGGSPLFLSDNKDLALVFKNDFINEMLTKKKENSLLWCWSRCYPRSGFPGDGVIVVAGGKLKEYCPVISYHSPNLPQKWPQHIEINKVSLNIVE